MIAQGRVQGGVIVLADGVSLPEGQEVTVLVPATKEVEPGKQGTHSVMDIPRVDLGGLLKPFSTDDDILGEMLEGRY